MTRWWDDPETILQRVIEDDGGSVELQAFMIGGDLWEYALVRWSNGIPSLNLLVRDGKILFKDPYARLSR